MPCDALFGAVWFVASMHFGATDCFVFRFEIEFVVCVSFCDCTVAATIVVGCGSCVGDGGFK